MNTVWYDRLMTFYALVAVNIVALVWLLPVWEKTSWAFGWRVVATTLIAWLILAIVTSLIYRRSSARAHQLRRFQ